MPLIPRFIASRWYAACVVAIVLLTAIAYAPALSGPQLFDDRQTIQDNPSITNFWLALRPPPGSPVTGRPVVNVSLAFNYWLNGLLGVDQSPDPGGATKTVSYHLLNLVLHIICGLLLLGIVRRTLRTGRTSARWAANADGAALAVAALWLLHPLQTDAVDYLTQRTEVIVSLCYLGTLYCSIRAWDAAATGGRDRTWFIAGTLTCLAGMASKEVMVSAPLMVVLYDRAFRTSSWREMLGPAYRRRRWFYAALASTVVLLAGLLLNNPRGAAVGFGSGIAWYDYLHTQGWAIAHYLRLALVPNALSLDYDFHPVAAGRGVPGLLLLAAFGVVTIIAWTRANRWGWLGFLGAWFFLILAPSSSVVPILTEFVAERRFYLPLAAIIVALLVAADALLQRAPSLARWGRTPARVLGVGLALLLAVLTFQRSRLYQSPEAIWRDATEKVPEDARAWNNLGVVFTHALPARNEAADSMYHVAVSIDSSYVDALLNAAVTDLRHEAYSEAEHFLRRGVQLDPARTSLFKLLGGILLDSGRPSEAEPFMAEVVRREPHSAMDLALLSLALADEGRTPDAMAAAERAIAEAGNDEPVYYYTGRAMLDAHQVEPARKLLARALQLDPTDSAARADLARLH